MSRRFGTNKTVIPAKAGIHFASAPSRAGWVPAFARTAV